MCICVLQTSLPELDTALSKKINSIIEDLEKRRQWCMRVCSTSFCSAVYFVSFFVCLKSVYY